MFTFNLFRTDNRVEQTDTVTVLPLLVRYNLLGVQIILCFSLVLIELYDTQGKHFRPIKTLQSSSRKLDFYGYAIDLFYCLIF